MNARLLVFRRIGHFTDRLLTGAIGFAFMALCWQAASSALSLDYFISSPLAVLTRVFEWIKSGYLWPHVFATLESTIAGFFLAAFGAFFVSALAAAGPLTRRVIEPIAFAAMSMPKIAFAPLLILWVGVGQIPVVILAFISSFFVIFFNILNGLKDVSIEYIDLAAVLGAGRWKTMFSFRIPAAAPVILPGLSQGLVYAFHGCLLGEMTSSNVGLGYVIVYSVTSVDSTGLIAALALIGVLSCLLIAPMKYVAGRSLTSTATDAAIV